jgi:hypothetical protein
LEIVPRRTVSYRGGTFFEMDLDAVLARAPEVTSVETDPTAQPLHGGAFDDIGGALAVLSRQARIFDGWSELERVDLRGAHLDKINLSRTCFVHSNLEGASLVDANLTDATMSDTVLRNTNLTSADLSGTKLTDADLTGAHLDGTVLLGANLANAQLQDATLHRVIADHTTTWPHGFTPPPDTRPARVVVPRRKIRIRRAYDRT